MRVHFPHRLPTLVVNRQAGRYHAIPVTGAACQALDPRLAAKVKASYALLPPFEPPRGAQEEAVAAIEVNDLCEPTIRRDAQGRFLKRVDAPPTATRFPMTDDEIRAAAKRILSHCPTGTKKPLALACGFRGEWALHTLRGIAKGRGKLVDATRRRLCDVLGRVLRGELVPVETGYSTDAGYPSHAWERAETNRALRNRIPFTP
jgi:hypothetical protein